MVSRSLHIDKFLLFDEGIKRAREMISVHQRNTSFADFNIELETKRNQLGFELEIFLESKKININTISLSALRSALNFLNELDRTNKLNSGKFSKVPGFKIRGIVEGFYGFPWTESEREDAFKKLGDFNMNTYLLSPKDIPWQRFQWREPFQEDFLGSVRKYVELGLIEGVELAVAVSPGLSVVYSDQNDVEYLLNRYRQLVSVGVKHLALLWDDIDSSLQNEADQKKYHNISEAHADFSNKVYQEILKLDPEITFTVCPMHYCGRGDESYLQVLGKSLNQEINLFWTGRSICSEYLEIVDAKVFQETTKRFPLYWDNFPVNDGSLRHSLFIGPVRSREDKLGQYSAGLLSNPMTQYHMSLFPLYTVGKYLWDPENYLPDKSWEESLEFLIPKEVERVALRTFLRNTMGTVTGGDPAPDVRKAFIDATYARRRGEIKEASSILKKEAQRLEEAYIVLTSPTFSHIEIYKDIEKWLVKFKIGYEVLGELSELISRTSFDISKNTMKEDFDLAWAVIRLRDRFDISPTNLFGDVIEGYLWELAAELGICQSV